MCHRRGEGAAGGWAVAMSGTGMFRKVCQQTDHPGGLGTGSDLAGVRCTQNSVFLIFPGHAVAAAGLRLLSAGSELCCPRGSPSHRWLLKFKKKNKGNLKFTSLDILATVRVPAIPSRAG